MAAIGLRHLANVCRQVGVQLRAGLDIRKVWQHESNHGAPSYRRHAKQVQVQIANGESLANAMRSVSPFFPPLTCDLVDVGEQSGRLEEVFLKLADHYDHMLKLRRQFLGEIAWPVIQLVMSICVIGGMILVLSILQPATNEPIKVLVFECTGRGLMLYILTVSIAMGSLAVGIVALAKGWLGAWPMSVITQIPVIGTCIKTMALSRFSWSFAMALNAGVAARKSMQLALRSTHNRHFTFHGEQIDGAIVVGQSFHQALQSTGAFPDDFLSALETAEISGTQSESLERLAAFYQERAESASKILTRVASFLIWTVTAGIIIVLIFQLFNDFILKPYDEAFDFLENG